MLKMFQCAFPQPLNCLSMLIRFAFPMGPFKDHKTLTFYWFTNTPYPPIFFLHKLIKNDKRLHFILYPLELFLGSVLVELFCALQPGGLSALSVTASVESFKSSPSSSLTANKLFSKWKKPSNKNDVFKIYCYGYCY